MTEQFEQQLKSKRNELRNLHEAYGGEFDGGGELHIVVSKDDPVTSIRVGIRYVLYPSVGIYFFCGFGEETDPQVYRASAIFRKRYPSAMAAYVSAIQAAKIANQPLVS